MKIAITKTISSSVSKKFVYNGYSVDVRLADYLTTELSLKNYGEAVNVIYVGLNCVDPKMRVPPGDFETGFFLYKKYTKPKKSLEFQIKLNHGEILKANTENELIDIIAEAVLKSYPEIEILDIKNFDIGKFYDDLKKLLQDRAWLDEPYQEKFFIYQPPQKDRTEFSQTEKMPEDMFWELVEKARAESQNDFHQQVKILTDRLSKKEEKEIIGFECTLRELLVKANHYNVMAVQKIVEGSVADDSFLYFRCKLILYGRITFENAINNPNYIFERIDPHVSGEPLLSIADKAFKMRFGENNDKVLPRDYASGVIDYDSGGYEIQGKDWKESDIPKRYSKLWKTYLK